MNFLKMLTAMLAGRRRVENTAPVYRGIYRGGGTSDGSNRHGIRREGKATPGYKLADLNTLQPRRWR